MYDPTEGEILLNGINIKEYDYDSYKDVFSVVFQDFQLFSNSITQNVAADVKYDINRVNSCLVKAGFEEKLNSLENGAETIIYKQDEENGIARALYKDSPIVILDEPTSALDQVAELEMYERFDEGHIAQKASHDELLKDKNGIYYLLWDAQAQYYK